MNFYIHLEWKKDILELIVGNVFVGESKNDS